MDDSRQDAASCKLTIHLDIQCLSAVCNCNLDPLLQINILNVAGRGRVRICSTKGRSKHSSHCVIGELLFIGGFRCRRARAVCADTENIVLGSDLDQECMEAIILDTEYLLRGSIILTEILELDPQIHREVTPIRKIQGLVGKALLNRRSDISILDAADYYITLLHRTAQIEELVNLL